MRRAARGMLGAGLVVASASCSLFVSLDGLNGGTASDAGVDASSFDSASDVTTDSTVAIDAGRDAGVDSGIFVDDFNRADNPAIGNGWIQKNPNSFVLSDDQVERIDEDALNFPDNVVYRPSSEDMLDVEASVQFVLTGTPGFPQVWTRLQRATIVEAGICNAYGLAISGDPTLAEIFRGQGDESSAVHLASISLSPSLDTTHTYRLRLRATGTNPVALQGFVEVMNGASWDLIGAGTVNDTDPAAIASPGSVGFSAAAGDSTGLYSYDNFTRTPL